MIKLIQLMTEQQTKLLQMGVQKQIASSLAEYREFRDSGGNGNLATAAREDVEWLESLNIKLHDLIYSDRI